MRIRTLLACALGALMAVVLLGMMSSPQGGSVSNAQASAAPLSEQVAQPTQTLTFPSGGFALDAPETWALMTRDELNELAAERDGRLFPDELIAGLFAKGPDGDVQAMVFLGTIKRHPGDTVNKGFDIIASVFNAKERFNWRGWIGGKTTHVKVNPDSLEIAGAPTAQLRIVQKERWAFQSELIITLIDLPAYRLNATIVSTDMAATAQIDAMLASIRTVTDS